MEGLTVELNEKYLPK